MPTQKTTIKMPSFSGGVAKTAPSKRRPDQVEEADNVFLSLERSSEKRHGTDFVKSDNRGTGDLNITEPTAGELVFENFRLDKDTSAFVVINPDATDAANVVQIFNMQTGNKITASSLNDTNGNMTKLKTYLQQGSGSYMDKIRITRVQDALVILNTEVEAKFKLFDEGAELEYKSLDRLAYVNANSTNDGAERDEKNGVMNFDDATFDLATTGSISAQRAIGRKIRNPDGDDDTADTDLDSDHFPYGIVPHYKYASRFQRRNPTRDNATIEFLKSSGYKASDNQRQSYIQQLSAIKDNQSSISVDKYTSLGPSPDSLRFSQEFTNYELEGITTPLWPVLRTPFVRNLDPIRNAMALLHSEGVDDVTWEFNDDHSNVDLKNRFGAHYLLGNPKDGDGFIFYIRQKSGPFPSGFYRTVSTPINFDLYESEYGKITTRYKGMRLFGLDGDEFSDTDDRNENYGKPVYRTIRPTPNRRIADEGEYPHITLTGFEGKAPYYQRIRTPELGSVFDRSTMPHLIAWNASASSPDFLVSEGPWSPRLSGNEFNNPGPSFISLSERPYEIGAKRATLSMILPLQARELYWHSSALDPSGFGNSGTTDGVLNTKGVNDDLFFEFEDAESPSTTKRYKSVALADVDDDPTSNGDPANTVYFHRGANPWAWACGFKDAIESSDGHNGTILVDISEFPKITLTQKTTGTQGNTTVTLGDDVIAYSTGGVNETVGDADPDDSAVIEDPGNFTGGTGTAGETPTNTGGKISAIGYWENRLWIASGNSIVSSQRNKPFNMWFDDGDEPTDNDPIDLSLSETDATKIQWIVPFATSCFLGTDGTQQFILSGAEDYISPSTIVLGKASEYSTSKTAKPLNIGESLYFSDAGRLFVYNKTKNGKEYSYSVSEPVFGYFPTTVTQTLLVPSNDYALFTTSDTNKKHHVYVFHQRLLPDGNIGQQAFYRWTYGDHQTTKPEIVKIGSTGDTLHVVTKEGSPSKYFIQTMSMARVLEDDILLDKKQVLSEATSTNGGNTQWLIPYVSTTASIVRHTNNFVPLTGLTYTNNGDGTTTIQQSGTTYASEPVTIGEPFTMKLELSPFILRDENSTHIDSLVQIKSLNVRHHKTGKYEVDITRRGRTNKKSDLLFDPAKGTNPLISFNDPETDTPLHTQKNGQFSARVAANADDVEIILRSTYHAPVNLTNIEAQVDANIGVNVSTEG